MKLFSIKSLVIFSLIPQLIFTFDCNLPNGCSLQPRKYDINQFSYEKNPFVDDFNAITCKPFRGYQFRFEVNDAMINNTCIINKIYEYEVVVFKWPKNHELIILDKSYDVTNMLAYLEYFNWYIDVRFVNLRGIDINLSDTNTSIIENNPSIAIFIFIASTMNFYTNGKLIKSCEDISDSNSTIMSIFQINRINGFDKKVAIDNCEFPNSICPLVFNNTIIDKLYLMGLVDSFYKKNTLRFTDDLFSNLNSTIYYLELDKVENINLDLSLLNPSVFNKLKKIFVYGSLKSIDKKLLKMLPDLFVIELNSVYFRKLIHENGIDWIKEINKNQTKIDLRNISEVKKIDQMGLKIKYINIQCDFYVQEAPIFEVFPDEDFCAYKDFPFDQLVILMKYCYYNETIDFINTDEFTCTYLWLTQHFESWYGFFWDTTISLNIKKIIESRSFKEKSKCNFEYQLYLCNKTNYKIDKIWSTIDYYYLNKKLQSAFKISSYLISLFGIASNLLTVITIVIKSNSDLFKGFKQYTYLCINSVFCLMILSINILSWTTECFYPFEVFCPEIRKIVFFQFFKIIFKECLTTTFRFMLNFTYVAFALNRIVTIKKDQNKFINFICEMYIKVYIVFSLIISVGLSFIKYFKYDINYDDPLMNYPISNEWDIFNVDLKKSHTFDDAYFIMNFISDIINYVIFVLICVFIDIYMAIELRQVMAEKLQKIERLFAHYSKAKVESAKKENDDIINKVIRMVVINTAIGLFFKMPISFIPILNVCASFYYKDFNMRYIYPSFGRFYSSLFSNGFYGQISDIAEFLFILSISIQPLIYKNFDKKFQIAFVRIFYKNTKLSVK